MQKLKKIVYFQIILLILIPSLLISLPKNSSEIHINEKNPEEINNTFSPQKSSVYYEDTTLDDTYAVYVSGDYAYIATDSAGLAIMNITDPTDPGLPVYRDTVPVSAYARDVFVSGNYAYMADYEYGGLAIIDISDPTSPGATVYSRDTTGYASGVFVSGDYAYVADSYSGLAIIDISNPTSPGATVYYRDTTGSANEVFVSGDYAYIADGDSGLSIIDISDPTSPGTTVYNRDLTGFAHGIYVSGDYAYLADSNLGLAIINISDPTNPGSPVYEDTSGWSYDVYISGDHAYVADGVSGLAIIDISDPTNPGLPSYENTGGTARGVCVSGDYAYIADYSTGLAVIDISIPIPPVLIDSTPTYAGAEGVYVSGDYAYIADSTYGLAVIDISDPTNPGLPVNRDTTGSARGVYVSGDYAYIADFGSGLSIIDISDPTSPGATIYNKGTTDNAADVYVSGDYAYLACWTSGLAVIDISDPTSPGTVYYENTDGTALGVFVSGDYAYVADAGYGLAVIDISVPTNPGLPVYQDTNGSAYDVYVNGDYAYVADYSTDSTTGLAVIDVSDPTNPVWVADETTSGWTQGVYVDGDYAYMADWGSGLAVIDISDPTNPGTPVYRNTAGGALGVYVSGDYAYIADYDNLAVIQVRKRVDRENPIILNTPNDFTVEAGYTGQSVSWNATDANPDTYTIELQGPGVISGPTAWTSGNAITYNILDGYGIGSYIFTVNFYDDYSHSKSESVTFTVETAIDPNITVNPVDFTVEIGYTGQNISWTATDDNPNNYTIELQGSGIVAGPTAWTSGVAVTYDIPDDFVIGDYIYTVNFTDDYGHSNTDNVTFIVSDMTDPTIISLPSDINVVFGYTGQSLSWNVTDLNPNNYTIELQGSGIVTGPTAWTSGVVITYNIPDGFAAGVYVYIVNFTDDNSNSINDSVTFTVEDTTNPSIASAPSDLTVDIGYTGQSLSWTATDPHPNTYTIELQGSGVVAGPTAWTSNVPIIYNIPDGIAVGNYTYTITFTDESGNSISESVTIIINSDGNPTPGGSIPFGNFFWIYIGFTIICLIFVKKHKLIHESRQLKDKTS